MRYDADYRATRRKASWGDFDLAGFHLEDMLMTVYYPEFRPLIVSIFSGKCAQLRKQWLLYDILCAQSIVGLFDNCLFSVYSPQSMASTSERADKSLRDVRMVCEAVSPFDFLS